MAWRSAGAYRIHDVRGGGFGTLRFAPLNSWPDNVRLDKSRRLLWPIEQEYGRKVSWADLIVFAGNCALESMGFKTLGKLEQIQTDFYKSQSGGKKVSLADLIVLGGCAAVEQAAKKAGQNGKFTDRPETLTNDFFVNLLDMSTGWRESADCDRTYEGCDRAGRQVKWTGTRVDLAFGLNSQLQALAEVYACDGAKECFVQGFVTEWNKVMNLDRFELAR